MKRRNEGQTPAPSDDPTATAYRNQASPTRKSRLTPRHLYTIVGVAFCVAAGSLIPLAEAAPKNPKPSAKGKVPTKKPSKSPMANTGNRAPDARYPYGGRPNGKFMGKLVGMSIDDSGHFEVSLSNGLGVRAFDGCKRRAADFPVVLEALWVGDDPVQLDVAGSCIRKITVWNFR